MASDRDEVTRRMRPGAWDVAGFLGDDEVLADRIDARPRHLRRARHHARGARRRSCSTCWPRHGLRGVHRDPGAGADGTTGRAITCPWALEQDEVCLLRARREPERRPVHDHASATGRSTGYTLSAHLIASHRFFGGLESRFRIDPVQAHALLARPDGEPDVEPGIELD